MAPKGSRAAAGGQSRPGKSAASLLDLLALEVLGTSTTQESRALAHSCLEVRGWPHTQTRPFEEVITIKLSEVWHATLLSAAR